MFYHCRLLKYVKYGKVYPSPISKVDDFMIPAYKWIGYYCKFFPQVWLSKNCQFPTGFKREFNKDNNSILFCFKDINGFPVSYDPWEFLLGCLINVKKNASIKTMNKKIIEDLKWIEKDSKKEKFKLDGDCKHWVDCGRNLEEYLKKHVFVEKDQVIVPNLDLRNAVKIICREEIHKKELINKGFNKKIIMVKNVACWKW